MSGYVKETIDLLTAKGATYETEDGALWLRSTDFGCDKDDVLRRANGFLYLFCGGYRLPSQQVREARL